MKDLKNKLRNLAHDTVVVLIKVLPRSQRRKLLTCQEASELLDSTEKLPFMKKRILSFHVAICQCCVNYKSQINVISNKVASIHKIELPKSTKERIEISKTDTLKALGLK